MMKELDTISLDFTVELLDYFKKNAFPSRKDNLLVRRSSEGNYSFGAAAVAGGVSNGINKLGNKMGEKVVAKMNQTIKDGATSEIKKSIASMET